MHWCNTCKTTDHNTSNCTSRAPPTNSKESLPTKKRLPPANSSLSSKLFDEPVANSSPANITSLENSEPDLITKSTLYEVTEMDQDEEGMEEEKTTEPDQKGNKSPISSPISTTTSAILI